MNLAIQDFHHGVFQGNLAETPGRDRRAVSTQRTFLPIPIQGRRNWEKNCFRLPLLTIRDYFHQSWMLSLPALFHVPSVQIALLRSWVVLHDVFPARFAHVVRRQLACQVGKKIVLSHGHDRLADRSRNHNTKLCPRQ